MTKQAAPLLILAIALSLFSVSCSPPTPQDRIDQHPTVFSKIPTSHQASARAGSLKKGMNKEAVFIAWGKADRTLSGNKNGQPFERWIYSRLEPVYHTGSHDRLGFGLGFGHPARLCKNGLSSSAIYNHPPEATVTFDRKSKVSEWTRIGLPN